ncbi:MAG TPA: GH25 family lysozyme [Lachnospiraceae bacterium]|nr:GH25 family lysozyme [Lachnospiraceae bacterium]
MSCKKQMKGMYYSMGKRKSRIPIIYSAILIIALLYSLIDIDRIAYAATKTLSTPTSVSVVSTSYNSITVSWNGVSGAGKYAVYRATSSKGSYTLIKTTTATSYEDAGVKTGKTYYYKVRAYKATGKSKIYSKYSSVKSTKTVPETPTNIIALASDYGIMDISWDSTNGASGYQVYSADPSNGEYEYVTTVTTNSYSEYELTEGETYSYKVRAYTIVGSSKVYSDYSPEASATIPIAVEPEPTPDIVKNQVTLQPGSSSKLTPTITSTDGTQLLFTWVSADSNIASVDAQGNVTAINEGTTTITATTSDGSRTEQFEITVGKDEITGIDVSKWQGAIQWDLVPSAGIEFAMIRSSFGSENVDPMFEANYQGAKENGISVGVYHYSYATTIEKAATEVQFLIDTLDGKQFEYPICIDIEDKCQSSLDMETLTDIVLVYLNGLEDAGYYPMIYSSKKWFTTKLDDTRLAEYDHWLAQWGTSITYPGKVDIWQYTSSGSVSGIAGRVDMNTSFVDYKTKIVSQGLNGF